MRILLALLALVSLVCSVPVLQPAGVPGLPAGVDEEFIEEEEDHSWSDSADQEEVPSLEDSEEVLLTAEETQEVSTLEANETEVENALVEYNKWSGWLNKYDKPVAWCYNCRRTALDGLYSVHSNYYEDRRWQYHAQTYPRGMTTSKQFWTGYTNWHETIHETIPHAVIVTIASYHSNKKEDRRFKALLRLINRKQWRRKNWRWSGMNKYDGVLSKNCGTGWIMGLYSRYSKRHRDRQFNVLCGWIVRKTNPTRAPRKPKTPLWVTKTHALSKSTTVTNAVSVTRKK